MQTEQPLATRTGGASGTTFIELRVLRPGMPTRRLRLSGVRYTFGSGQSCSVRLHDAEIPPLHAQLLRDDQTALLRAQDAPVSVNGQEVFERVLQPGDHFALGPYQFEVLELGGALEPADEPQWSPATPTEEPAFEAPSRDASPGPAPSPADTDSQSLRLAFARGMQVVAAPRCDPQRPDARVPDARDGQRAALNRFGSLRRAARRGGLQRPAELTRPPAELPRPGGDPAALQQLQSQIGTLTAQIATLELQLQEQRAAQQQEAAAIPVELIETLRHEHQVQLERLGDEHQRREQSLEEQIETLQEQLSSLQNEAETQRRASEASQEEAEQQRADWHRQQAALTDRVTQLSRDLGQASSELDEAQQANGELTEQIERLQLLLQQVEGDLASRPTSAQLAEAQKALDQSRALLDETRQTLQETQSRLDTTRSAHAARQRELEQTSGRLETTSADLEKSNRQLEATSAALESKSTELERTASELERTVAELERTSRQLESTSADLERTTGQLESTSAELERTTGQLESTSADLERTTGQLESTSADLERTTGQLESTSAELDAMTGQLEAARRQVAESAVELSAVREELFAKQQQLEKVRAERDQRGDLPELTEERGWVAPEALERDADRGAMEEIEGDADFGPPAAEATMAFEPLGSASPQDSDREDLDPVRGVFPPDPLRPSPFPSASIAPAPLDAAEPDAGPYPAADSTPYPTADSTPYPAADPTPYPAADSTPYPTVDSTPFPAQDPAPFPAADSTPYPAHDSTPFPAHDSAPIPDYDPAPFPAADSTPFPAADSGANHLGEAHRSLHEAGDWDEPSELGEGRNVDASGALEAGPRWEGTEEERVEDDYGATAAVDLDSLRSAISHDENVEGWRGDATPEDVPPEVSAAEAFPADDAIEPPRAETAAVMEEATEDGSAEEEDDSIEAYMNRLLQRVQGGQPPTGTLGSSPTPPPKPKAPVQTAPAPVPATAPAAAPDTVPHAEEGLMEVPRSQAPERNSDLAAMRDLANSSARSAIALSVRRELVRRILGKLGYAGAAFAAGSVILYINGKQLGWQVVAAGCVFGLGGFFAYEALVIYQTVRARVLQLAQSQSGAAAKPAATAAAPAQESSPQNAAPQGDAPPASDGGSA